MSKSKYVTRQRKMLLTYLEQHPDETLSARAIADALKSERVSLSAIYRNLSALESEGKLRRISRTASREVCFQYLDAPPCREKLHLSCTRCGRTFHMDTEETREFISNVSKIDGFEIDKTETVLYGVCDTCRK